MSDAVRSKEERVPFRQLVELIPATEEKRFLKKIEDSSTRKLRDEMEQTLGIYEAGEKRAILAQINGMLDAFNKSESHMRKIDKECGFFEFRPVRFLEPNPSLNYINASAKFLPAEQLSDVIQLATIMAEKRRDPQYTLKSFYRLSKVSPQNADRMISLSTALLKKGADPDDLLLPISRMTQRCQELCTDGLLSLSEQLLEKNKNPQPTILRVCELPAPFLETHWEKILSLSMKLAERSIDPESAILSISILPRKPFASQIDSILTSSIEKAEQGINPAGTILTPVAFPTTSIRWRLRYYKEKAESSQELSKELSKRAKANMAKGKITRDQLWTMERSMESLLAFPEEFEKVAYVALYLLEQKRNPNDLFLLSKSIINYSPGDFEASLPRLKDIAINIKHFDALLSQTFQHSKEFKESDFENFVFYKLDKILRRKPEDFCAYLSMVWHYVNNKENPEEIFKKVPPLNT